VSATVGWELVRAMEPVVGVRWASGWPWAVESRPRPGVVALGWVEERSAEARGLEKGWLSAGVLNQAREWLLGEVRELNEEQV